MRKFRLTERKSTAQGHGETGFPPPNIWRSSPEHLPNDLFILWRSWWQAKVFRVNSLNSLGFSFSFDFFFHFQRLWVCLCYNFPSYLSPSVTWATTLSSLLQQKESGLESTHLHPSSPSCVTRASCLSCLGAPGSVIVEWEWQYLFMGTFWTLNVTMYTDFLLCLSPGRTKQMQHITMLISFYGCYRVWLKEFCDRNWVNEVTK